MPTINDFEDYIRQLHAADTKIKDIKEFLLG